MRSTNWRNNVSNEVIETQVIYPEVEVMDQWKVEQHEDNVLRLEAMLEWHKDNPELSSEVYIGNIYIYATNDEKMRHFSSLLGTYTKHSDSYSVSARQPLIKGQTFPYVSVSIDHSSFCEKVEDGTETVEEEVYPDDVKPNIVVTTKPKYKWVCPDSWK